MSAREFMVAAALAIGIVLAIVITGKLVLLYWLLVVVLVCVLLVIAKRAQR